MISDQSCPADRDQQRCEGRVLSGAAVLLPRLSSLFLSLLAGAVERRTSLAPHLSPRLSPLTAHAPSHSPTLSLALLLACSLAHSRSHSLPPSLTHNHRHRQHSTAHSRVRGVLSSSSPLTTDNPPLTSSVRSSWKNSRHQGYVVSCDRRSVPEHQRGSFAVLSVGTDGGVSRHFAGDSRVARGFSRQHAPDVRVAVGHRNSTLVVSPWCRFLSFFLAFSLSFFLSFFFVWRAYFVSA